MLANLIVLFVSILLTIIILSLAIWSTVYLVSSHSLLLGLLWLGFLLIIIGSIALTSMEFKNV